MKNLLVFIGVALLFLVPAFAQDNPLAGKFIAAGIGYDTDSVSGIIGWGAICVPIKESIGLVSITDYDVSVLPGKMDLQNFLSGEATQFSMRTGLAQKIFRVKNVTVNGLASAGVGTGGAPQITKGSFAYGGLVDVALGKGWGVDAILQTEKNVSASGFRFIPRFGLRYKF